VTDKELYYKLEPKGCWHEFNRIEDINQAYGGVGRCSCGEVMTCWHWNTEHRLLNPDFSTWEGFGWLWDRVQSIDLPFIYRNAIYTGYIKPTDFRDALKEYLEETP